MASPGRSAEAAGASGGLASRDILAPTRKPFRPRVAATTWANARGFNEGKEASRNARRLFRLRMEATSSSTGPGKPHHAEHMPAERGAAQDGLRVRRALCGSKEDPHQLQDPQGLPPVGKGQGHAAAFMECPKHSPHRRRRRTPNKRSARARRRRRRRRANTGGLPLQEGEAERPPRKAAQRASRGGAARLLPQSERVLRRPLRWAIFAAKVVRECYPQHSTPVEGRKKRERPFATYPVDVPGVFGTGKKICKRLT